MYNYNHLYYFYVAAKFGGINAAAKHLKISQPSLSTQMKVLESTLNLKLFQKIGKGNQLTEDGCIIFGYCRRMFEISEEMNEELSIKVPSASRRIHIGISNEVDRSFVIEIVSSFLKQHALTHRPKVTVVSGAHDILVERLRFRELDAIVTQQAVSTSELENLRYAEVPVVLTCGLPTKNSSKSPKVQALNSVKQLAKQKDAQWVMPSQNFKLRSEIDHFFEANDLKGRIVFESDVMASVVRSVRDGIGLAFIPLLYIAREVREKSLQVLGPKKGYWKYRVWLACHQQNKSDHLISGLARAFSNVSSKSI